MRGTAVREWHAQRVRPRAVALDLALVLLVARVHDPPERLGEVDFHQEPLGLAGQGHWMTSQLVEWRATPGAAATKTNTRLERFDGETEGNTWNVLFKKYRTTGFLCFYKRADKVFLLWGTHSLSLAGLSYGSH